ncbi:NCK-interacting protein with SH3 domain [Zootermopsis nevadensis]|uniref:NCK-interacting protein with SH3 domain n=2 Tax=Zootermopsis nevadensis TaxID=136037 RepID=A0A067QKR1_ZOONE|nr:NCK-interacting protein with SH3 domain [Zootermopsis nevadensis]
MSRVAVSVVVRGLCSLLPHSVAPQLNAILMHLQGPLAAPQPLIEETHDARRLRVIFTELTSCKEDSQQRSWILYEDETTITEYIQELVSILTNADANVSRHVLSGDKYQGVTTLLQYYQMEIRWSIRQLLLQAFGIMCSLDTTVVTIMLNSVLPMELARDMCTNPRNIPRLKYSSLLLTMVFSMGEPMPVTHMEHLGVNFMSFLFDLIESPPDTDVEDQIPDLFLNLVLAYNLQFAPDAENVMLKALLQRTVAKTFTEKTLLLFNREEDPVRIFEHVPAPPNSVLKLFVDLFSNAQTAALFYTNDTKVLIDIIVRQLADLSPGDSRRQQYLQLCQLVMRNTPYYDHHHRQDDILKCFTRIFCEETEQSKTDQKLVREISNEFPQYFKA